MQALDMLVCDTFAASSAVTIDGSIIFGKNSDRQPNEPHEIQHLKGENTQSATLKCTYITIPQVEQINEVILSKPNWIWGAEMGANEHGVVIGNEAVWTTEQKNEEALIGMDLLRLALERSNTAENAINVITQLLDIHGQGGNCGFSKKEFYDNSFVIADQNEAWVLETAGKFWIAEKVETIRTISNCLTIEEKFDKIHPDLIDYAIDSGKCNSKEDFNFKSQFSSKYSIVRIGAKGDTRRACTLKILQKESGKISPSSAMSVLRSHNDESPNFHPRQSSMASPCVHASSMLTPSQSTGSMVSHITKNTPIHWLTGTSGPCISVFKPMVFGGENFNFPNLNNNYTPNTLWWEHERLHRLALPNFPKSIKIFDDQRLDFENQLLSQVYNNDFSIKPESLTDITVNAFEKNMELIETWHQDLESKRSKASLGAFRYNSYWNKLSKKAKLPK